MMKTTIAVLAATSMLALSSPPGFAQDGDGFQRGREGGGMRQMFNRLDSDNSGDISLEEFETLGMLGDLGAIDTDNDGILSVDEIIAHMDARRAERRRERIERRFDLDGDGQITIAEIESQRQKRFALMDSNDDGTISRDEARRSGGLMGRGRSDAGRGEGYRGKQGRDGGGYHHGGWRQRW